MKLHCLLVLLAASLAGKLPAAALKESTLTQVVNDVSVLTLPAQAAKTARVNDLVQAPEVVRTGAQSRAELKAPDQTLTRVGANSVFSFEGAGRGMKLEQGSVLFHSPKGKGGGTIKTGGASAAVLGTTVIVAATRDGGFKTIILEGRGRVTLANGKSVDLQAGQLVFVLPGGKDFGPVLTINLGKLVAGSNLVRGFTGDLPSFGEIERAIAAQDRWIANGKAEDTNYLVGDSATRDDVKVIDANTQDMAVRDQFLLDAFQLALERDAVIDRPDLDQSRVFLNPIGFEGGGVFAARNIAVTTSSIDLSPYRESNLDFFTILANGDLEIFNSVEFVGSTGGGAVAAASVKEEGGDQGSTGSPFAVYLSAAGTLRLAPDSDLSLSDLTDLAISSGGSASFTDNGFYAPDGSIGIASAGGDLSFDEAHFEALAQVQLSAAGVLDVKNASFSQPRGFDDSFRNFEAARVQLFQDALAIAMDARTLSLADVAFPDGSTVTLRSELGLLAPNPNTGAAVVPGHVNFIRNVTYGESQAQNEVYSSENVEGRIRITTRQP